MSIGTKIQEIRKAHDLSQEQLAERYGVTRQTVSNWENDKHYPDMEILKRISDEFDVSFDTLLKDDEVYIKTIDKDRKKLTLWKKLLIVFFVIIVGLVVAFFSFLHFAFRGTPDGKRITTDTDVKMMVHIADSSPSNAITRTYDAETFNSYSETKKTELRSETGGRLEGDIPHVSIEKRDNSYVELRFQDLDYKDIEPKIEKVTLYTASGMPVEPIMRSDKKLDYKYENGTITVFLSDLFKENELTFSESPDALVSGDDPEKAKLAVWFCIFEVKYSIGDKEYVSLTSVAL
ncbi:MAG TPA: helix-turn-helix transcriptional regulator [Mogibacterium sp.]|nr:helix-turn-helix transcriptional regulator [Mogibacterium sp.]